MTKFFIKTDHTFRKECILEIYFVVLVCLGNSKHLIIVTQITFNHIPTDANWESKTIWVLPVRFMKELLLYMPIILQAAWRIRKKKEKETWPYSIHFKVIYSGMQ